MAVDPIIKQKADDIRHKIYGKEVRESLASGLETMSEDVVEVTDRQATVEEQFQSVLNETTGKDVISAPELIAARNGELDLKTRLDKEKQEVTAQLAQKVTQNVVQAVPSNLSTFASGSVVMVKDNPFWQDDFKGGVIDVDKWKVISGDTFISQNDKLVFDTSSAFENKSGIHSKKGFYKNINGKVSLRVLEPSTHGGVSQALIEFHQVPVTDISTPDYWSNLVLHLNNSENKLELSLVDKFNQRKYWYIPSQSWVTDRRRLETFPYAKGNIIKLVIRIDGVNDRIRFTLINETQKSTLETSVFPASSIFGGNVFYPHIIDSSDIVTKSIELLDIRYEGDI